MWFPNKKKVIAELSALHAHSKGMEDQLFLIAEGFKDGAALFGPVDEIIAFQQELADTTRALYLASAAVFTERVSSRIMAKKLPMFRAQLIAYQQAISATRQSLSAIRGSGT